MTVKPGSVAFMQSSSGTHAASRDTPVVTRFSALGATIDDNGGAHSVHGEVIARIQRLAFGCFANKLFWRLSFENRFLHIHRRVLGIIAFSAAVSKPTNEFTDKLNRLQRWIFSRTHHIHKTDDESPAEFQLRRHRASARQCQATGLWGTAAMKQFIKWAQHASRRHLFNNCPWYVQLLNWHGNSWLAARRASRGSNAGTGTRNTPGRPAARHADLVTRISARLR